jgi:hypothetical protein
MLLIVASGGGSTATALSYNKLNQVQKRLLSGYADLELNPDSAANVAPSAPSFAQAAAIAAATTNSSNPSTPTSYSPGSDGCSQVLWGNVKVNQNCLNVSDPNLQGRSQAQNETSIAADPNNSNHLVASANDYRRGDGTCGVYYSLNGGLTWEDGTTPNGFTSGAAFGAARQYWQAGGDTAVAWDSKGNAYLLCQVFLRGLGTTSNPDQSSAVYIFRSTQNNGASWNFTGRPVVEANDVIGSGAILEDKPYMTVDNHSGSPYQDRVYVTWTEFAPDGTGYIWESYSNDYGEHFSPRVLVSGNSSFCTNTFGLPTPLGNCNENQFSQPFTGPDGALYVTYDNYNNTVTGLDNRNQVLLAKSTDGGASFSAPVKVGDYYDLPDCFTYQAGQDAGRACVPEKGPTTNSVFRATNYPAGAVNPRHPNQVVISFGSYINTDSKEPNCVPNGFSPFGLNLYTGVKSTPGCKNAILLSVSNDAGATFTGGATDPRALKDITRQDGQKSTDQFWQWLAFTASGKLAVSYYDRQYGNDETTGYSDFSVSFASNLTDFTAKRATSSSNPPPTQFSGVFMGDYTGLDAVDRGPLSIAYPFWSDTRNAELFLCPGTGAPGVPPQVCTAAAPNAKVANDQEVFTVPLPLFGKDH